MGEHDLKRDDDKAEPIDVGVKDRIIHSDYHPRTFDNDIALLVLERDVQFTDKIAPICLPSVYDFVQKKDFTGTTPRVAGWGTTAFRGSTSDVLLEISLTVGMSDVFKALNLSPHWLLDSAHFEWISKGS